MLYKQLHLSKSCGVNNFPHDDNVSFLVRSQPSYSEYLTSRFWCPLSQKSDFLASSLWHTCLNHCHIWAVMSFDGTHREIFLEPSRVELLLCWKSYKDSTKIRMKDNVLYNGAWGPSCPYSLYIFWAPQNSFLLPLNVHFCPYIGDVPALPISSPHTVSLWGTKFLLWIILFFLIVSTLLSWEALFTFHFLKETSSKCCPCAWFPSISLL